MPTLLSCSKEGHRSIFQFEQSGPDLEVWFARITPENQDVILQLVGKVPDTIEIRKLIQSHLEMHDDDTWVEPDEWFNVVE